MNKQVKVLANGIEYISCNYLSFGDYDNSCAVERANVRYLKELDELKESIDSWSMESWERGDYHSNEKDSFGLYKWLPIETDAKLVECYGSYNSIQLWVRKDVWKELELDSLEDYCSLNDEMVSEIEMEMEDEAWENNVKSDLIKTLPDELTEEEMDNQECRCLNCNWEGKVNELKDDIVYGKDICPNCNNHYSMKYYDMELKTLREFADELDNEILWEIYRYCCDKTNTYGIVESGGNWYIDIDRLKECFANVIEEYRNGNVFCNSCYGHFGQINNLNGPIVCPDCNGTGFTVKTVTGESNQ